MIGITTGLEADKGGSLLPRGYSDGVAQAGGNPLLLPVLDDPEVLLEALECLQGLILSGGPDLDPLFYGEEPLPGLGEVQPERDRVELALARRALAADLPVLGICRGCQVLAVAGGGDLFQDLGRQRAGVLKHYQKAPRWYPTHAATVEPASRLAALLKVEGLRVNSFHHQAVRRIPDGFAASAWAPDGVIEALESGSHRLALGVQWHPENLWHREPAAMRLFEGIVEAARAGGDRT
ncbi:MAG: gamma-glutamyl-gamma-aminobutyrate hydrolase family protein [bacterium]|nr:gamma-glutamyl-gamma-aminobutyrate hydrolase family protein [bacterium]